MAINAVLKEDIKKYLADKAAEQKKTAVIISAYNLNQSEIAQVLKNFKFLKRFKITISVDPKIMAGLIIKFNTKVIDLSLLGQLKKFKKLLYEID